MTTEELRAALAAAVGDTARVSTGDSERDLHAEDITFHRPHRPDVVMLDAGLQAPPGLVARVAGRTVWRRKGWAEYSEHRLDPASDPDLMWISSLSLGGLSNYWTSAVPRYAPEDFTEGGRIDERFVWPVTYDDLAPYYDIVESQMGLTSGDPLVRQYCIGANSKLASVPQTAVPFHHESPSSFEKPAAA